MAAIAGQIRGGAAMSEWQTIENAPKDGTEVLITAHGVFAVAAYSDYAGWRDMGDIGWGGMTECAPTHWMPIPSPPNPGAK